MSSVIIAGNTSGTVTLDAPAVAGTTVLTLPTTSGTVITTGSTTGISGSAISTGTIGVSVGGTGATSLTANNVILGNGASAVQFVAPGSNGNLLTSNGTTWTSAAAPSSTPTTAQVGTASAGFAVGDVGTYAFLTYTGGGGGAAVSAGTNYTGSGLKFAGVGPSTGASSTSVTTGTSGSATSGTWKAMGTTTPHSGSFYALTLFLRVA